MLIDNVDRQFPSTPFAIQEGREGVFDFLDIAQAKGMTFQIPLVFFLLVCVLPEPSIQKDRSNGSDTHHQ